jgi:hypothetical protein
LKIPRIFVLNFLIKVWRALSWLQCPDFPWEEEESVVQRLGSRQFLCLTKHINTVCFTERYICLLSLKLLSDTTVVNAALVRSCKSSKWDWKNNPPFFLAVLWVENYRLLRCDTV